MPLSSSEAREKYIVRSLYDYLAAQVAPGYNSEVSTTNYPALLGLSLEWPDDPAQSPTMPMIILDPPEDSGPPKSAGLGGGAVWKYKQFHLYCFPAITTEGKPSVSAAETLRSALDYVLGTGIYIPILDYSQNPVVQLDAMEVLDARMLKPTVSFAPLLSIEKHRFDYLLTTRYMVAAING